MSVRREIPEKDGIYFITLTCARWLHLFEKGEWNLVSDVCEYAHSSAKFYITGQTGLYEVINYLNLKDVDLTRYEQID